jgi:hypothetical protein
MKKFEDIFIWIAIIIISIFAIVVLLGVFVKYQRLPRNQRCIGARDIWL